jgi:hypothetical protein
LHAVAARNLQNHTGRGSIGRIADADLVDAGLADGEPFLLDDVDRQLGKPASGADSGMTIIAVSVPFRDKPGQVTVTNRWLRSPGCRATLAIRARKKSASICRG